MSKHSLRRIGGASLAVALVWAVAVPSAQATHSWGGYHWARTTNPLTVTLGDNVSGPWDVYLDTSVADWSTSAVLDVLKTPGTSNPKSCKPVAGTVQVCNAAYGRTGWLGIAQISISAQHITQGTVKLNDTYFKTSRYNTPAWRNLVMCQEIGHTLGLDHQDENFNNANLGTCMDYTNDPSTNQHPNAHDYGELETIYSHLDTAATVSSPGATGAAASDWGRLMSGPAHGPGVAIFVRGFGNDQHVLTFVIWA